LDRGVWGVLVKGGGGGGLGWGGFLRLEYRRREAPEELRLAGFRAVVNGQTLRVRYGSVSSGGVAERRLLPTGFGHDGFRWHVRAYCFKHGGYRDFVLGRLEAILETEEPRKKPPALPRDEAWLATVELRMRVNPKLPQEVREILCEDFALAADGTLYWPVRQALEHYARHYLESLAHPVGEPGGRMVAWFVK